MHSQNPENSMQEGLPVAKIALPSLPNLAKTVNQDLPKTAILSIIAMVVPLVLLFLFAMTCLFALSMHIMFVWTKALSAQ
jgi:hypothetical protein